MQMNKNNIYKSMKSLLKTIILFAILSVSTISAITLPYTIEAEECEGVDKVWTSVYETKIGGEFSGKGFAYLQGGKFSFEVTVEEDGMYQFNAKVAQILNKEGRLQTISINGIEYSYTVPYYDYWTDFDFGVHRLN